MKRSVLTGLILFLAGIAYTQNYARHLKISGPSAYFQQVKNNPRKKLVEIKKYIPGIVLDIRYATTNNFTHHQLYPQAKAFARLPVVLALQQVEAALAKRGLGLKIYDAYRPYAVTVQFYKLVSDTNFVADPRKGSKHNRGCAVDLTLVDLKTKKELDMPTGFDSFSIRAYSGYAGVSSLQLYNRALLKSAMESNGFTELRSEWWHFDFNGWKNYELLDVPFTALSD